MWRALSRAWRFKQRARTQVVLCAGVFDEAGQAVHSSSGALSLANHTLRILPIVLMQYSVGVPASLLSLFAANRRCSSTFPIESWAWVW